jgi:hypothetical protein
MCCKRSTYSALIKKQPCVTGEAQFPTACGELSSTVTAAIAALAATD